MDPIHISLIQMDIAYGQKDRNFSKAASFVKVASSRVDSSIPHIICFPELFSTGYDLRNIHHHAENIPDGKTTNFLKNLALKYSTTVIASYIEKEEGKFYNTGVIIDEQGEFKGKYRKIHLFPLDPLDETE